MDVLVEHHEGLENVCLELHTLEMLDVREISLYWDVKNSALVEVYCRVGMVWSEVMKYLEDLLVEYH